MTEKEKEILAIIKAEPLIEQSQIAERLGISRSTVAVHISSLQKQGLLLGKGYIVNEKGYVLGIGAANVDVYGKSRIPLRTHYDHPADITSSVGGVMRNIICNYSLLGGECKLMTAYSDDSYGKTIKEDCELNGIDISESLYLKGRSSGIFMQIQDENNDMYLAICDMSILEDITPEFIRQKENVIAGSRLLVIDPSLNDETIEEILKICENKIPVCLDPISDNYARKMAPYAGRFDLIKPNQSELEQLSGIKIDSEEDIYKAGETLLAKGTKKLVISRSKEGIIYMDGSVTIKRKLPPEKKVINASGAGDALMAAMIYGQINDLPIEETLDLGLAAGIAAIRSPSTINEKMSLTLLEDILKEKKNEL